MAGQNKDYEPIVFTLDEIGQLRGGLVHQYKEWDRSDRPCRRWFSAGFRTYCIHGRNAGGVRNSIQKVGQR